MKKQLTFLVVFMLVFFLLVINFVSAGSSIDPKVEEALQNQNEVWVFFKIRTDLSNWDSRTLEEKRVEAENLQNKITPILIEVGVKEIHGFDSSPFISGYITKDGLNKLRNNPDIVRIEIVGKTHTLSDENNFPSKKRFYLEYIIPIILIIIILYLIIKIRKKKGH